MSYKPRKDYSLLSTQNASSASSVSFTSLISSNFSVYKILVNNLVHVTDNTNLLLTFSTDNGSTYLSANYKWSNGWQATGVSGSNQSASDSSIRIYDSASNTTANANNLILYFFNLNTTLPAQIFGDNVQYNRLGGLASYKIYGINTGTTAVNAIKFTSSSGNLTGDFYFYGSNVF